MWHDILDIFCNCHSTNASRKSWVFSVAFTQKSGGPIYFNGLVRKPFHFAHMALYFTHSNDTYPNTLPFSLTISKVKLQNVSKRCLFSIFFLMRKTTFWISDSIWNTQVFSLPQFCAWLIFGGCGRGQKNQTGLDRDCRYAAKAALSSLIYGPPNSSPPKDLAYIYLDAGNAIKNAVHISIFEGGGTFSKIDYWCIFGE